MGKREIIGPETMCPTCQSTRVRRSKRRSLRDRIMKLAGMSPYRCRDCQKRFYVNASTDVTLQNDRRRQKELEAEMADGVSD